MTKKALVISGGGSKGAFAVGAVQALLRQAPGLNFDIYVGTSTGSLIVPLVAAGRPDLLEQLYTSIHTNDVILGGNLATRLLQSVSLFDATPLSDLINKYYNEATARQIMNGAGAVYITTVCLQTGDSVVFTTKAPPSAGSYTMVKIKDDTIFRRAILASACQPGFMQPVEIDKAAVPLRQYVDGGVREYLGIQIAIDAGADEIFAISLRPYKNDTEEKKFTTAIDILFRTIDIFSADVGANDAALPAVYNGALQYIAGVKAGMRAAGVAQPVIDNYFNLPSRPLFTGRRPLRIHTIYPDALLGGGAGGLVFDPAEMKAMLAKGRSRMQQYIASLPPGSTDWV